MTRCRMCGKGGMFFKVNAVGLCAECAAKPDHEFYGKISGVTFDCPYTGQPRQAIIFKHVRQGMQIFPKREPDNPHSKYAVGLWINSHAKDYHIGYLSEPVGREIAPLLDSGKRVEIYVKEVTGTQRKTLGVNIVIRTWN